MELIQLKPITIEELTLLQEQIKNLQNGDCNLSIASLIGRAEEYHIRYALVEGALVLNWRPYKGASDGWVIPWNHEKIIEIIQALEKDSLEQCQQLVLYGRFSEITQRIESLMPYRNFVTLSSNSWWDYLYDRENFIKLEGRKFHGKRNFIKRFYNQHPNAKLLPITVENIPNCREFLDQWYAEQAELSQGLLDESKAIHTAFDHWEEFRLTGGILVDEEKTLGFTIGSMVSQEIFAIHFEKADRNVIGAYPTLSVEMAKMIPETVKWLNREEDLGIAGLRKAKQDWFPSDVIRKTFLKLEKESEFGSNCKKRTPCSCGCGQQNNF